MNGLPSAEAVAAGLISVAAGVSDLLLSVLLLALVERRYGIEGLGEFSFFFSLFVLAAKVAYAGIGRWVENETALGPGQQSPGRPGARALALTGGAAAALLAAVAARAMTADPARGLAFAAVAAAVPLSCMNALRRSLLHGSGRHTAASRLQAERSLLLLGASSVLLVAGLPPPLLALAFPAGEFALLLRSRKAAPLPRRFLKRRKGEGPAVDTVRRSAAFFFSDQSFGSLLNIDFLVLGLFVDAYELGLYARAAILARAFLVVPSGLQPVFRRLYARRPPPGGREATSMLRQATAALFTFHGLLAAFGVVYFPRLFYTFVAPRGELDPSLRIFSILVPGLLYYASLLPSEPLLQVAGRAGRLQRTAGTAFLANLLLNVYLVPYAGAEGAATASTLSMGVHFLLFRRSLPEPAAIPAGRYLLAGGAVYLSCVAAAGLARSPWTGSALPLLLLPALLAAAGLYGGGPSAEGAGPV